MTRAGGGIRCPARSDVSDRSLLVEIEAAASISTRRDLSLMSLCSLRQVPRTPHSAQYVQPNQWVCIGFTWNVKNIAHIFVNGCDLNEIAVWTGREQSGLSRAADEAEWEPDHTAEEMPNEHCAGSIRHASYAVSAIAVRFAN